jgi:hypothetical protein
VHHEPDVKETKPAAKTNEQGVSLGFRRVRISIDFLVASCYGRQVFSLQECLAVVVIIAL